MLKAASMSSEEKRWEAESDARTLARAEEIKADSKRVQKASQAAKKMALEASKEAASMQKVASGKVKTTKKQTSSPGPVKKAPPKRTSTGKKK